MAHFLARLNMNSMQLVTLFVSLNMKTVGKLIARASSDSNGNAQVEKFLKENVPTMD